LGGCIGLGGVTLRKKNTKSFKKKQNFLPVVVELLHVLVSFSHVHIPDLSQQLAVDIHPHLSKHKCAQ